MLVHTARHFQNIAIEFLIAHMLFWVSCVRGSVERRQIEKTSRSEIIVHSLTSERTQHHSLLTEVSWSKAVLSSKASETQSDIILPHACRATGQTESENVTSRSTKPFSICKEMQLIIPNAQPSSKSVYMNISLLSPLQGLLLQFRRRGACHRKHACEQTHSLSNAQEKMCGTAWSRLRSRSSADIPSRDTICSATQHIGLALVHLFSLAEPSWRRTQTRLIDLCRFSTPPARMMDMDGWHLS